MKAIQITLDERLIEQLDRDPDVVERGRSAVIREAVRIHLKRRREAGIDDAYRRGYAKTPPAEFAGWGDEGSWPDE